MVLKSRGSEAEGYPTKDGFVVKAGSRISPNVVPALSKYKQAQRLYLISEHIIDDDYVFASDYTFPTAAWAAAVISGMHGRKSMWKDN